MLTREKTLRAHIKQRDLLLAQARNQQSDAPPTPHAPPPHADSAASPGNDLSASPLKLHLASDLDSEPVQANVSRREHSPIPHSNLESECPSLSSNYSEHATAPLPEELPPGWRCRQSRKWGRPFYYHSASGRSQWHPPSPADGRAQIDPGSWQPPIPLNLGHQSSTMC